VPLTHGFRKFAITQFKKAQVDFNDREYFVGHKTSRRLDRSYDRTSEEDRLAQYMKAIELLTISPENRLRKHVAEQEHTIQVQMTQMNQENATLKKEINKMRDEWHALLSEPEKFMEMLQQGRRKG
jgi:N12 class adenine-specific DNA methylase